MTYLTTAQVDKLLSGIHPDRVYSLNGNSYVAQHDIRASMNRIFGFGRWSTDVIETVLLYEEETKTQGGKDAWKVGYRATVKVTVCAPDGTYLAHYTDSHAQGSAPQPSRGDAHAMGLTVAVSTAFKRACTNLGDQFGLSLYNKGQIKPFVFSTLVHPDGTVQEDATVKVTGEYDPDVAQAPVEDQAETNTQPVEPPVDPKQADIDALVAEILGPVHGRRNLHFAKITAKAGTLGALSTIVQDAEGNSLTVKALIDREMAS